MDMLLPTVDMPRPGYAPMDMLLPIVDRPLLGYAPMDMLLWIRCHGYVPSNYGYAPAKWIRCHGYVLSQLWICFYQDFS